MKELNRDADIRHSNTQKSKRRYLYHTFLLSFLLISLTLSSFAWLTPRRASDTPLTFGGGSVENLPLSVGIVPAGLGESERVFTPLSADIDGVLRLGFHLLERDSNNYYKIKMSDLQFGRINNLSLLNPENIIYLRLTIPANIGNNVAFRLYYDEDDTKGRYSVYKNVFDSEMQPLGQMNILDDLGDTYAQTALDALPSLELEYGSFIRYEYCLSDSFIDNGDVLSLSFDSGAFDFDGGGGAVINTTYDGEYNTVDNEEYYYLYVKITPNLLAISYLTQHITRYMPCYMTYSVGAEFEITE